MVKTYASGRIILEWSTFEREIDKARDKLNLRRHTRIVLGEILRNTVGFTNEDGKNRTGYWLSPRFVERETEINYRTIRRDYEELAKRNIITTHQERWKKKGTITWVEVNLNLNEWV